MGGQQRCFVRVLNNYARYSAYYINVNSNEPPARVQNAVLTNQPASHVVTNYDSYAIHEKETINLMKTGQRWYGETFDANLTQSFSLNIPNLNPSEPARVRGFMAAKNGSNNGNTNFQVRYNNSLVGTAILNGTLDDSYSRGGFVSASGAFNPSSSTFSLQVSFNRVSPSDAGYLDFLEVNAKSYLRYFNGIQFRDLSSVGAGNVAEMQISNFPNNGKKSEENKSEL